MKKLWSLKRPELRLKKPKMGLSLIIVANLFLNKGRLRCQAKSEEILQHQDPIEGFSKSSGGRR
jgi:hypothetical protein